MYLAIVLVPGQGSVRWGPWKVLGEIFYNFCVGELPGTVTFCSWLQTILISSYSWIFFSVFSMATKVQIWGPLLVPAFFYLGILSQTTAVESSFFPKQSHILLELLSSVICGHSYLQTREHRCGVNVDWWPPRRVQDALATCLCPVTYSRTRQSRLGAIVDITHSWVTHPF